MPFALDWSDSEVRDVTAEGGSVRVRLSAASVRDGQGRRGWLAGVVLSLVDATLAGDPTHAFGRVAEGRLRQDGRDIPRPSLPDTLAGELELSLRMANGTQLTCTARSLALDAGDVTRFTEDLSC